MRDPYDILGVPRTASTDDIRKAYRRLAKTLHPDLNPGDKAAEERFKEASSAYDLLSDTEKRQRFDRGEIDASGSERPAQRFYKDYASGADADPRYQSASGFADFADTDDLFAELFARQAGGRRRVRGADLHYHLSIEFLDAVNGATQRLALPDGGSLDVTIPPGIEAGQILRLKGKGARPPGEGEPGDALIEIAVKPHRFFERRGDDIHVELPVTLNEALFGGRVKAPTPSGSVMLSIPKASNNGATLRLKGKGVRHGAKQGDLLVKLKLMLPEAPDAALEAFLSSWAGSGYDPRKDML